MVQIFNALVKFFKEDGWFFEEADEGFSLRVHYTGDNGEWECLAEARQEAEQLLFFSNCALIAPADKRTAIAEFITRANYDLVIGNFIFDFETGEIRYKTSLDIHEVNLTSDLIKRMVYANVLMMDQYLPGIEAVLSQNVSPVDAIIKIEEDNF